MVAASVSAPHEARVEVTSSIGADGTIAITSRIVTIPLHGADEARQQHSAEVRQHYAEGLDLVNAIRDKLVQEGTRILDLLRDWDDDKSGSVRAPPYSSFDSSRSAAKRLPHTHHYPLARLCPQVDKKEFRRAVQQLGLI